jgi:hypothetical protein
MSLYPEKEELKRIGDLLDNRFKKPNPVPLPKAAENYGNAIRLYFDRPNLAYSEYSLELEKLEQFKGSQYYESAEQSARAKYTASAESAKQDAVRLIGEAVEQMRQNYVALTQKSIPADIMQQMQVFSMLKHPTAEQYERYQEAFKGYPSAQEVLINKYDEEAKPVTEIGKNEYGLKAEVVLSKGYTPKYGGGVLFCPERPLTYGVVDSLLNRLVKNAENSFATNLPGELAEREFLRQGQYVNSAIVRGTMKAETPEEIMSSVSLSDDGEILGFLQQTDKYYRPSTKLYKKADEIPKQDVTGSAAESIGKQFAQKREEEHIRRERAIDYYVVGHAGNSAESSTKPTDTP